MGCEKGADPTPNGGDPNTTNKILNVGDSRVAGARPEFESYRYELWKNMIAGDWSVDFIGPLQDDASYPAFMGLAFDRDHAGVGGFQTIDILREMETITGIMDTPSIILMDIGGNDLLGGRPVDETIANINTIIDQFQEIYPDAILAIEQIAPGMTGIMTSQILQSFTAFNQKIMEVSNQQSNANQTVIAVDMAAGWSDEYLADDLHYNEKGAKVVADRYYQAIKPFLNNE